MVRFALHVRFTHLASNLVMGGNQGENSGVSTLFTNISRGTEDGYERVPYLLILPLWIQRGYSECQTNETQLLRTLFQQRCVHIASPAIL